mgnify:CR=1 FL=1|jgi:glycosyltransferase involved in cell wall biosynthesis|tara:strand:- start:666 stop:1658 length:993 start_codon:yes stop_codon:yes gene_type:complete
MNDYYPKISIGVPVYNVEKYIERCAVSLFEQTYTNIEYVFVDDCTPDSSINILEKVIPRYSTRKPDVKLIRNPINLGSAATRNIILDNSTGEFILWVDSDDFIELDAIEKLIELQKKHNCDILDFGVMKHTSDRKFLYMSDLFSTPKGMFSSIMERKTHNALWGRLIRRSLIVENNIRFEDGQDVGEDLKVIIILSYFAKSVFSVQDVFYHFNSTNSLSLMSSFSAEKEMMTWHNIDITKSFFKGKGIFYEEAFNKFEAKTIVRQMIRCCYDPYNNFEFYKYLKRRSKYLRIIDLKDVDFAKKLIYIIPSYSIAKLMTRVMIRVKRVFSL